jgi:hypothetical protein
MTPRGEWWVVSQVKDRLFVECEGFRSKKAAVHWRDEHYPEGLLLQVSLGVVKRPPGER